MGKGRSGAGGGARDNTKWGTGDVGGFKAHTDPEEIQKQVGNESWEERLTDDQKEALDMYMNREYAFERMNEALRHPEKEASEEVQKWNTDLEAALDDSYLKQNIVVARRSDASLIGGAETAADVKKMYGQVVTDPGFTSSSAKVDFEAFKSTRDVEYHIKVPGRQKGVGAYVQHFGKSGDEYEFLFNRGSSFRILGGYESFGKLHVNMEYVGRFKS